MRSSIGSIAVALVLLTACGGRRSGPAIPDGGEAVQSVVRLDTLAVSTVRMGMRESVSIGADTLWSCTHLDALQRGRTDVESWKLPMLFSPRDSCIRDLYGELATLASRDGDQHALNVMDRLCRRGGGLTRSATDVAVFSVFGRNPVVLGKYFYAHRNDSLRCLEQRLVTLLPHQLRYDDIDRGAKHAVFESILRQRSPGLTPAEGRYFEHVLHDWLMLQ